MIASDRCPNHDGTHKCHKPRGHTGQHGSVFVDSSGPRIYLWGAGRTSRTRSLSIAKEN